MIEIPAKEQQQQNNPHTHTPYTKLTASIGNCV